MQLPELSQEEKQFITAYRLANNRGKHVALQILRENRKRMITIGEIISLSSAIGESIDALLAKE